MVMAQAPVIVDLFQTYFQHYFDGTCCIIIILLNSISLLIQLRRAVKKTRYGMLFMLLVTFICFGVVNIPSIVLRIVPWDSRRIIFARNPETLWLAAVAPYLSQQIVSISGALLALDRVLIMCLKLNYGRYNCSVILSVISCSVNTVLIIVFFLVIIFAGHSTLVINAHEYLKNCLLSATLVLETTLYFIFLVKFRKYVKKNMGNNQESVQTNQIVFFQAVCHLLLCTVPNAVACFSIMTPIGRTVEWLKHVLIFSEPMYCASVLLTSVFTLYKLTPKKDVVQVVSTSTTSNASSNSNNLKHPKYRNKCYFSVF
uniref:G_PROTEIN_RECEP_F1_2 domain-containing protein n=1 Tax=Steinernema glaseri TaxID=37863 RepID=A0A1I8AQ56_9BILA